MIVRVTYTVPYRGNNFYEAEEVLLVVAILTISLR